MEITLPSGNKVELKENITARDHLELKHFITRRLKLRTEQDGYTKSGKPQFNTAPEINGEDIAELEILTVKKYLVSFNGDKQNPYEKMMDTINGQEYEMIKEKIDELHSLQEKK
ncbi:hypothetical protein D6827_01100 [Candidatus Parcubacteria bacterium]|nr:MAG: hypothetical protein D6827_01100 [Candidatus Parcubacteria bacterium]